MEARLTEEFQHRERLARAYSDQLMWMYRLHGAYEAARLVERDEVERCDDLAERKRRVLAVARDVVHLIAEAAR